MVDCYLVKTAYRIFRRDFLIIEPFAPSISYLYTLLMLTNWCLGWGCWWTCYCNRGCSVQH